jgi:hypothetical protein
VSNGCPISASRRAWIPTTRLNRSTRQTIPTSAPAADTACRHEAGWPSEDSGNALVPCPLQIASCAGRSAPVFFLLWCCAARMV